MKQQDLQLAVLTIAGFVIFGLSSPSTAPAGFENTDLQRSVLGAESDRSSCVGSETCVDVEVVTSVVKNNISTRNQDVTYRVVVTNHGPDTAHNIKIKNNIPKSALPMGLEGDFITGSYSAEYDFYFIPELLPNTTTFIDIETMFTPIMCKSVQNTIPTIFHVDEYDTNHTNNFDQTMIVVPWCPKW